MKKLTCGLLLLNLLAFNFVSAKPLAEKIRGLTNSVSAGSSLTKKVCETANHDKFELMASDLADARIREIEDAKKLKCELKRVKKSSYTRIYNCDHRKKVVFKYDYDPCKLDSMKIKKNSGKVKLRLL